MCMLQYDWQGRSIEYHRAEIGTLLWVVLVGYGLVFVNIQWLYEIHFKYKSLFLR